MWDSFEELKNYTGIWYKNGKAHSLVKDDVAVVVDPETEK